MFRIHGRCIFQAFLRQIFSNIKTFSSIARSIRVLAKIESSKSLQKLEEIVEASDGIMVARGDLGVEIPLEQIPAVQEKITQVCRQLNKPVIIASELLESMIEYPTPTRAEVLNLNHLKISLDGLQYTLRNFVVS